MKKSLFEEALSIAIKKIEFHPQYRNFIHYSFVVQNNKILGYGKNNFREPPKYYGYHEKFRDKQIVPRFHAEIDSYFNSRHLIDRRFPFDMINIRLNRQLKIRLSKPCEPCFNLLTDLGCRRFYYSSLIGWLKT